MPEEPDEQEKRRNAERELSEHDRLMQRHAARDVLHDASAGQQAGEYTTQEARDRAAHTPSILDRDAPRNAAEEAQMIDALHKELFPKEHPIETPTTKERQLYVTPEQQASIDKALSRADLNDKLGGASEVNGPPRPNDPTSLDKVKEIGQDLHKQGVALDKE